MKKGIIFLIVIMLLCLTGCTSFKSDKPVVVATIFPQYDMARAIGGDFIDLHMIIRSGIDTHNYDPSVDDILCIKKCDLFIYTYEEMEQWAVGLKDDNGSNVLELATLEGIELKEVEDEESHEHHHHHHDYDPHIWTSITHLKIMAEGIRDALCKIDPIHSDIYKQNAITYMNALDEIDYEMQGLQIDARDTTYYFATPFAMYYLFNEYDLAYYSLYDTCSMEVEPSIDTVIEMSKIIKDQGIKYIYVKELNSTNMAERVTQGTDCEILLLHSGHNVSKTDFERGITLIDILKQNLENLRKGIQ